HIINEYAAEVSSRRCEMDCEPRIVELSVIIEYTRFQSVLSHVWQKSLDLLAPEQRGVRVAVAPGHPVVDLEAHAIKEFSPPSVIGYDKRLHVHHMRCVFHEYAAFEQCFVNQFDIALTEVPHAPVNKFRAAARRSFGEVRLFQ